MLLRLWYRTTIIVVQEHSLCGIGALRSRPCSSTVVPPGRKGQSAMARKRSLAERRLRWFTVIRNFEKFSGDVPHLKKEVDELKMLDGEVLALVAEQAHYRARTQEITRRIGVLSKQADNLRGRIGSALRAHFGFGSTVLLQLGFRPLPSKHRLARELDSLETPSPVGTVPPEEPGEGSEGDS